MKQLILTQFPWPWLPTASLVIFFVFFASMVLFTGLKTRRAIFTSASQLPLQDGDPTPNASRVAIDSASGERP